MRKCPRCQIIPDWKYGHCTSHAHGVPVQSLMCYCEHCRPFMARAVLVPLSETNAWEKKWDLFVVQLFRAYTRTWTRDSRKNFWNRICHNSAHVRHLPGQMTLKSIAETKAYNEANRAAKIEDDEDRAF